MKFLRRLVFFTAVIVIVVCAGLLITAYDPSKEFYRNITDFPFFSLLALGLGSTVILLIWEVIAKLFPIFRTRQQHSKSTIAISPHQSSRKAKATFDDYDQFLQSASERARKTLDD